MSDFKKLKKQKDDYIKNEEEAIERGEAAAAADGEQPNSAAKPRAAPAQLGAANDDLEDPDAK